MKTIYNLKKGDRVYYKNYSHNNKYIPTILNVIYTEEQGTINAQLIKNLIEHDNAYISEEECQRSIDYDVALAKISNRAYELYDDEIEQDYCYIDFDEDTGSLWYYATHQLDDEEELRGYARRRTGYRLCFDKDICGRLIEEFPEECKTVLGVD